MNGQNESGAGKQKTSEKKPIFACNMLALNAQERKPQRIDRHKLARRGKIIIPC